MYKKNQKIHFVGIGGIGMSGIAELLLNLNYEVSGSDLRRTATTDRLTDRQRETEGECVRPVSACESTRFGLGWAGRDAVAPETAEREAGDLVNERERGSSGENENR